MTPCLFVHKNVVTSQPQLLFSMDVDIPNDKRVGQVHVFEGDNPLQLAHEFARDYGVDMIYKKQIADLIKVQVDSFYASEKKKAQIAARESNRRKIAKWRESHTTVQRPFTLKTEERSSRRGETFARDDREVVGRLHVMVGPNKGLSSTHSTIIIREGDVAMDLARNFARQYDLPYDQVEQLEQKISNSINEAHGLRGVGSPSSHNSRSPTNRTHTNASTPHNNSSAPIRRDFKDKDFTDAFDNLSKEDKARSEFGSLAAQSLTPSQKILLDKTLAAASSKFSDVVHPAAAPPSSISLAADVRVDEPETVEALRPDEKPSLPLFNLDVDIGNGKRVQVVIYDDDKPGEVAEAFCAFHELDDSIIERLERLIATNMEEHIAKLHSNTT
jgi:hypothetical protein